MSRDEYFDKMSYSFYRKGNNVNVTIYNVYKRTIVLRDQQRANIKIFYHRSYLFTDANTDMNRKGLFQKKR